MKCPIGNISFCGDVYELMCNDVYFAKFVIDSLIRYSNGDWGNDSRMNECSMKRHGNVWCLYTKDDQPEIMICTGSNHYSTTVKFPDEIGLLKY